MQAPCRKRLVGIQTQIHFAARQQAVTGTGANNRADNMKMNSVDCSRSQPTLQQHLKKTDYWLTCNNDSMSQN